MSNRYGESYPKILLCGDSGSGQTTLITVNFDVTGIRISQPIFKPVRKVYRALNGDTVLVGKKFLFLYKIDYQIPNDTAGNSLMNDIDTIIQWKNMTSYTVGVRVYEDLQMILYPHSDESQNYNVYLDDFDKSYIADKIIGYEGNLSFKGTEYETKNTFISQSGTFA
jgi:hypothetical protein